MTELNKIIELAMPLVLDLTDNIIVVLDRTGKILFVNDKVLSWVGYQKEELVGKNIALSKIIAPGSVKIALQNMALRFFGRDIEPYNLDFVAKNGNPISGVINGKLIKDEDGVVVGDLIVISDITQNKKLEQAFEEEKKKTDIYIDLIAMMVIALDKDGRITLINNKGCEILKTTKENVIGKDWFATFIPESDRAETLKTFNKIVAGDLEGVEHFENKIITTTGEERVISWHNTYLKDNSGNITTTLSSGEDVTESKGAQEELLKKTKELEKMNQLMVGRELRMMELKKEIEKSKGGDTNG